MTEIFKNIIYYARRFKMPTALNILGLVVAFSSFYLLMTQIIYQATYNHNVEDYDRIYRLDTDYMGNEYEFNDNIHLPFTLALDSLPQVESVSLVCYINDENFFPNFYKTPFRNKDGKKTTFNCYPCNNTAISTLTNKKLSGSIEWDNQDPSSWGVVIPESIAKECFGRTDVSNDSIHLYDENGQQAQSWPVQGVYKDFPPDSELKNGIFVNIGDAHQYKHNFSTTFSCLVKFKQAPKDVETLNRRLKEIVYNMMEKEGWESYTQIDNIEDFKKNIKHTHFRFTPIAYSYFYSTSNNTGKHGYTAMFILLVLACLLLIIIATIHFLNFTLVESPMRIRSQNTRLILGATRRQLRRGIIAECVVTSLIACVIALLLCSLLALWPLVDRLTEGNLSPLHHWALSLSMLVMAVAVGIAAGYYPAAFVTSFAPATALKGDFGLTPQGHKLRRAILCLQLFASLLMVIYMGILIDEHRFIFKSDYGFDKGRVLMSPLPLATNRSEELGLCEELSALPGVQSVSMSDGTMGLADTHYKHGIIIENKRIDLSFTGVDWSYLRTLGIEVVEGRDFLPTDTAAIIFSQSAQQQWEWVKVGTRIPINGGNDSVTIVGVCEDIRYNTTRLLSDEPFAFVVRNHIAGLFNLSIGVNADADLDTVREKANAILREHFKKEAKPLVSYDEKLEKSYANELRFFEWFYFLCIIFTIITLIGVFCMAMFESEYRRKEIGIRKITGAKTSEVVWMLCKQYIPLILISFAIAAPIAYLCGRLTLNYFAEHTVIHWWIFPLSLALISTVTLGTVALQSWRTARENPVNSITAE